MLKWFVSKRKQVKDSCFEVHLAFVAHQFEMCVSNACSYIDTCDSVQMLERK